MKNIAIFGSTGSIGQSTVDVVRALEGFHAVALSGHKNLERLAEQAEILRPRWVVLTDESADAASAAWPKGTEVLAGRGALEWVAEQPEVDTVVSAIVGRAGLESTLAAVRAGKRVALANKESMVVAGALVQNLARQTGAEIVPVDSEHSAIFQSLRGGRREELRRVLLTASGGPFFRTPFEELKNVTPAQALKHPTWNMGAKVTLDSATLMNKALEIIEARWLFDLDVTADELRVLIHPQSVIHSMVEFCDGAVIAQHSPPDMRLPIQFALTYPARCPGGPTRRTDWTRDQKLEFFIPDESPRFDALRLGLEAAARGGTSGCALNAANEVAVAAFVAGKLRFDEIVPFVRNIVENHAWVENPTLQQLLELHELVSSLAR